MPELENPAGTLCVDEGCPHYGIPHVCVIRPAFDTVDCEPCVGTGLTEPMLSSIDPANEDCEICGGYGDVQRVSVRVPFGVEERLQYWWPAYWVGCREGFFIGVALMAAVVAIFSNWIL